MSKDINIKEAEKIFKDLMKRPLFNNHQQTLHLVWMSDIENYCIVPNSAVVQSNGELIPILSKQPANA
jgi:hypothetical protein